MNGTRIQVAGKGQSMAYSRTSIPLFTLFLLTIAAYLLYLILTKNVFQLDRVNRTSINQSSFQTSDASLTTATQNPDVQTSNADSTLLKKTILGKPKTPTQTIALQTKQEDSAEKSPAADRLSETDQSINATQNAVAGTSNQSAALNVSEQKLQPLNAFQHKILWDKYSARVPRLYSRALSEDTQIGLSRVGEISMNLDLLYLQDRGTWMIRVDEARDELVNIALKGEREGARALSFQYFRGPVGTTESLAWAMIANAMAPNDYFLTICMNRPAGCTEEVFERASERAINTVVNMGFVVKK